MIYESFRFVYAVKKTKITQKLLHELENNMLDLQLYIIDLKKKCRFTWDQIKNMSVDLVIFNFLTNKMVTKKVKKLFW